MVSRSSAKKDDQDRHADDGGDHADGDLLGLADQASGEIAERDDDGAEGDRQRQVQFGDFAREEAGKVRDDQADEDDRPRHADGAGGQAAGQKKRERELQPVGQAERARHGGIETQELKRPADQRQASEAGHRDGKQKERMVPAARIETARQPFEEYLDACRSPSGYESDRQRLQHRPDRDAAEGNPQGAEFAPERESIHDAAGRDPAQHPHGRQPRQRNCFKLGVRTRLVGIDAEQQEHRHRQRRPLRYPHDRGIGERIARDGLEQQSSHREVNAGENTGGDAGQPNVHDDGPRLGGAFACEDGGDVGRAKIDDPEERGQRKGAENEQEADRRVPDRPSPPDGVQGERAHAALSS